jgi:hypothetical protein
LTAIVPSPRDGGGLYDVFIIYVSSSLLEAFTQISILPASSRFYIVISALEIGLQYYTISGKYATLC